MQWLGVQPEKRTQASYIADAVSKGIQGYDTAKLKKKEQKRYNTKAGIDLEDLRLRQIGSIQAGERVTQAGERLKGEALSRDLTRAMNEATIKYRGQQAAGLSESLDIDRTKAEGKILNDLMDKILLVPIEKRQNAIDASRGLMEQAGFESVAKALEDPKILDLLSGTQTSDSPSATEVALGYIAKGEPMPGLTMDETKKRAGALINEKKITGADIKVFEQNEPTQLFGWFRKSEEEKETDRMRKLMRAQWSGSKGKTSVGVGSDPEGFR